MSIGDYEKSLSFLLEVCNEIKSVDGLMKLHAPAYFFHKVTCSYILQGEYFFQCGRMKMDVFFLFFTALHIQIDILLFVKRLPV